MSSASHGSGRLLVATIHSCAGPDVVASGPHESSVGQLKRELLVGVLVNVVLIVVLLIVVLIVVI
jgi:hypothetical protein